MKAITIKQPYATLIAQELKRFETRSRLTKHRGAIAIHASKSIDHEAFNNPVIQQRLLQLGIENRNELPTGCVIAIAEIKECHKVQVDYCSMYDEEKVLTDKGHLIEGDEWWFGDYNEGRYAWELMNVKRINPVAAKGQLNLWNWEVPNTEISFQDKSTKGRDT